MRLMAHPDSEVQRRALLCVQRIMLPKVGGLCLSLRLPAGYGFVRRVVRCRACRGTCCQRWASVIASGQRGGCPVSPAGVAGPLCVCGCVIGQTMQTLIKQG